MSFSDEVLIAYADGELAEPVPQRSGARGAGRSPRWLRASRATRPCATR